MLTILLKILSVLGILLLVILGLLLLIILLVLFVPVLYRIKVNKKDDWNISVKANWLLGLLRVQFLYPEPGTATAKVLFFKIFDSGAEKPGPKKKEAKQKDAKKKVKEEPVKEREDSAERKDSQTSGAESAKASVKSVQADSGAAYSASDDTAGNATASSGNDRESSGRADSQERDGQTPIEKIQYTFHNIYDKIKNIRENTEHYKELLLNEDTKGLLNHAFMRLGKILKSIRPRKLKADVRFGTGSPDTTGYVYAIYGILCPYLGRHALLVPDFEQAVLEGNLYVAGHITVFKLLWHGLMLVLDKRFRQLISKFKQED